MEFEKQRRAEEKFKRQQAAGSFAGNVYKSKFY